MNEGLSFISRYCLDTNVFIQAWQKYYSPKICPSYWEVLNGLGLQDRIFICEDVYDEIRRKGDELADWLKTSSIPVEAKTTDILVSWRNILAADERHKYLVDNRRGRSLADPWVIATALRLNACVVTKEDLVSDPTAKTVKIPNVCKNMGVRCITDFEMIEALNISFTCNF